MAKPDDTDTNDASADAAPKAATAKPQPSKKGKPPEPVQIGPESLLDRLQPHMKTIAIGAGVAFVVLGGFFTVRWYQHSKASAATNEFAKFLDVAQRKIVAPTPVTPDSPPPPASKEPTFGSAKERAEAALTALTKAGSVGDPGLMQAALLAQAGRLDEAEKLYTSLASAAGLDGVLAREGLGYTLEARAAASKDAGEQQKLLEQALAAFQKMQPDAKGPRADYALYHQARILDQLTRTAEAKAMLAKALEIAPESDIKPDIEARTALLEAGGS